MSVIIGAIIGAIRKKIIHAAARLFGIWLDDD